MISIKAFFNSMNLGLRNIINSNSMKQKLFIFSFIMLFIRNLQCRKFHTMQNYYSLTTYFFINLPLPRLIRTFNAIIAFVQKLTVLKTKIIEQEKKYYSKSHLEKKKRRNSIRLNQ